MPPRLLAWVGFAVVHGVLIAVCVAGIGNPLGDVLGAYFGWVQEAYRGIRVGIDVPWVYPALAFLPMIAAGIAGAAQFGQVWLVLVTLANAVAFLILLGRGRLSRRRFAAAWWWLLFLVLFGPIALTRVDSITVPLAILAVLWLAGRPALAASLVTVAAWMKVWPAALLAAMLTCSPRRKRILLTAVAVTAAVVVLGLALGAGGNLFGFVFQQTGRGLQIEAPAATPLLWLVAAGIPGYRIYYDTQILTYQVQGPGVELISGITTIAMVLAVLALAVLGIVRARRGAPMKELLPSLALAFVLVLIVCNKVGSPQFLLWLVAPVLLAIVWGSSRRRIFAIATLVLAALTQLVYPYFYDWLLAAHPLSVLILTLRNLLETALLGVTIWAVASLSPYEHKC